MIPKSTEFSIKLAETPDEKRAAQRLRYRVFVEELGAKTDPNSAALGIERDVYDDHFNHLILQDKTLPDTDNVVGVYRLLLGEDEGKGLGFYSADEFQLDKIIGCGRKTVELGRSCVDPRYRGGLAMHLLWNGLADHVSEHRIEVLFGVASFPGTDAGAIAHGLSYLHHKHLAPLDLRVAAHGKNAISMDILSEKETDRLAALKQIPPQIKSYLRLGGTVGDGAYVDHEFNTIDVCLVVDTARMTQKYKTYYQRDMSA